MLALLIPSPRGGNRDRVGSYTGGQVLGDSTEFHCPHAGRFLPELRNPADFTLRRRVFPFMVGDVHASIGAHLPPGSTDNIRENY